MTNVLDSIQNDIDALEQRLKDTQAKYKQLENDLAQGATDIDRVHELPSLQATMQVILKRIGFLKEDKKAAETRTMIDNHQQLASAYAELKAKRQQVDDHIAELQEQLAQAQQTRATIDSEIQVPRGRWLASYNDLRERGASEDALKIDREYGLR